MMKHIGRKFCTGNNDLIRFTLAVHIHMKLQIIDDTKSAYILCHYHHVYHFVAGAQSVIIIARVSGRQIGGTHK